MIIGYSNNTKLIQHPFQKLIALFTIVLLLFKRKDFIEFLHYSRKDFIEVLHANF